MEHKVLDLRVFVGIRGHCFGRTRRICNWHGNLGLNCLSRCVLRSERLAADVWPSKALWRFRIRWTRLDPWRVLRKIVREYSRQLQATTSATAALCPLTKLRLHIQPRSILGRKPCA